jgi:CRISPR system Cascade subunit CasA
MSIDCAFNLITEPIIGARLTGERQLSFLTLPGVLAELARDEVEEFRALRPHQRHPWHALCVQLAAMALQRAGVTETPLDEAAPANEAEWAALLRGLTPEWPDDAPWRLVSPPDQPAFMQAPAPDGDLSDYKAEIPTPDALDMLVTSKNHDLKSEVMTCARPEDWVFALISLQTMEGFMGAGNYGISRMNGGFASRPAVGVVPAASPGARFVRDLRILLRSRQAILANNDLKPTVGLGLVWVRPWDGHDQIRFSDLDPFYIEICRRVRLEDHAGLLVARVSGSRKARISAAELKGRTGDLWTPIEQTDSAGKAWPEPKALTITGDGFSYQKMTELLLRSRYQQPFAQEIADDDADTGLAISACGLARGQGKTEGYHERIVPISKRVVSLFRTRATDALAGWAAERVEEAGQLRGKVLRSALFALLQDGPDQVNFRAAETSDRADRFLERLDKAIDATFFDDLWQEEEQAEAGEAARLAVRIAWHRRFAEVAHDLLLEAADSVPHASMRRYRARVRAERVFFGARNKYFPHLQAKESKADDAGTYV